MTRIPRDVLRYTPLGAMRSGGGTLGEPTAARTYLVRRGDTFSGIARTLGVTPEQLLETNPRAPRIQHLGRTLLDLEEHQVLRAPAATLGAAEGEACTVSADCDGFGIECYKGVCIDTSKFATNVPDGAPCNFDYMCVSGKCDGGAFWSKGTCAASPTGGSGGGGSTPDPVAPPEPTNPATPPENDCATGQVYDPAAPGGFYCFTCDTPGTIYNLSTHDCECKPALVWNQSAGACLTGAGGGGGGTTTRPPLPTPDTKKTVVSAEQSKSSVGTIVAVSAVGAAVAGLAIYLATRKKSSR
jgi:hypothetical protein